MNRLLVDAGTTWSKVFELYNNESELLESPLNQALNHIINTDYNFTDIDGNSLKGRIFLFPSNLLSKTQILFDKATGHMVKKNIKKDGQYENEVIALAYGAKKILKDLNNATIIDLGSRDIKWVKFIDGKYKDLDWNGSCGSATGATVEMLCKFYNINTAEIAVQDEKIHVTCGVFAMEKIMDDIASDISAEIAIAKYIHGIAFNTWNFAGQPDKVYLSGGFCLNQCFINSLKKYCEVMPLGRFVLLEGLY